MAENATILICGRRAIVGAIMIRTFPCLVLLLFSSSLWGAPAASVDGVQLPAWVERVGVKQPLQPGMALAGGDAVVSGESARVLLLLREGSHVRLGANARLDLKDLPSAKSDMFSATLDLVRGAFRFTTARAKKALQRDVSVKIASITIGIRGTDVWGKAGADKDIVCLLEGKVNVDHLGNNFDMDGDMLFYIAPKNKPPLPLGPVTQKQVDIWAKETDIQEGQGAITQGGKWRVYAGSFDTQQAVLDRYDLLRNAGYPAQISPITKGGVTEYRVRINKVASRADAEYIAANLAKTLGVSEAKAFR